MLPIRHRYAADCQPYGLDARGTRIKLKKCLFHGHYVPTALLCRTLFEGSRHLFLPTLKNKKRHREGVFFVFRAGKGSRTLDIDLGKVALYQLSYSRECSKFNKKGRFVKGFWKFGAIFALLCLHKRFWGALAAFRGAPEPNNIFSYPVYGGVVPLCLVRICSKN